MRWRIFAGPVVPDIVKPGGSTGTNCMKERSFIDTNILIQIIEGVRIQNPFFQFKPE
jgi:hypothetical protein